MTVIATIITRYFTAHATDSLITRVTPSGGREVVEAKASKLVRVPAFRGAMAYWGVASSDRAKWNTKDWLQKQADAATKHESAEAFALALAGQLTVEWRARGLVAPNGLGIHFSSYELVGGYWIPELFSITNWADVSYNSFRPGGFIAARRIYATLANSDDPHPQSTSGGLRQVHSALHSDPATIFRFNNGDPMLFNPIAGAIMGSFETLLRRKELNDAKSWETHVALVRRPVEVVSKILRDFAKSDAKRVGGKAHDLAISPGGMYFSTTGKKQTPIPV